MHLFFVLFVKLREFLTREQPIGKAKSGFHRASRLPSERTNAVVLL